MGEYSKYIAPERRAVPTPYSIVDENGKAVFGTFDKEFKSMDFLKIKRPTSAPQFMNRLKLTLWQATEVNLRDGLLLAVVCDMGIFGKTMNVFYDKRAKKVYTWDTNLKSKDTKIAPTLLNGDVSEGETPVSHVKYVNSLDKNKLYLSGFHKGKCFIDSKEYSEKPTIEYDFELTRVSKPCCVSIPFPGSPINNRPLYSQKDLYSVSGKLVFNGEEFKVDENAGAIMDDHRGYYPRKAHYDWVSTMGKLNIDGKMKWFGFNLTRNQSLDQEKYNENIIWFENETSILPPVTFTRNPETKDYLASRGKCEWIVKDEHDMVNLKFKVYNLNAMLMHAVVVNIDYYITFGELEGYLRDEDGKKYILDGLTGIGEDKTLLL